MSAISIILVILAVWVFWKFTKWFYRLVMALFVGFVLTLTTAAIVVYHEELIKSFKLILTSI